jgi:hypothetical protein
VISRAGWRLPAPPVQLHGRGPFEDSLVLPFFGDGALFRPTVQARMDEPEALAGVVAYDCNACITSAANAFAD